MTEPRHVLVINGGGVVPGLLHQLAPALRISTICRHRLLAKIADPADRHVLVSLPDDSGDDGWLAAARLVHELQPVDLVVCFSESDNWRAPVIADALGLPCPNTALSARAVNDKALMRQLLRQAGVDDTPSAAVTGAAEIRRFADEHGYPLIVKPRNGTGSQGVAKLTGPADIETGWAWSSQDRQLEPVGGLVERFHAGREFSVEAFSQDGHVHVLGITGKAVDAGFVEIGHEFPAEVSADEAGQIIELVGRALGALGVRSGPSHTEVIGAAGRFHIVETHLRLAGDRIPALVHDSVGVDLPLLWARQVLGESVTAELATLDRRAPRFSGVRFLTADRAGTLRRITLPDQAGGVAIFGEVLRPAGSVLDAWPHGSQDRLAVLSAVADSRAELRQALDEAVTGCVVEIERAEQP